MDHLASPGRALDEACPAAGNASAAPAPSAVPESAPAGRPNAYQEIKDSLRALYLEDERPWLVGFSGGKDSTLVASLVFETVATRRRAPAPGTQTNAFPGG